MDPNKYGKPINTMCASPDPLFFFLLCRRGPADDLRHQRAGLHHRLLPQVRHIHGQIWYVTHLHSLSPSHTHKLSHFKRLPTIIVVQLFNQPPSKIVKPRSLFEWTDCYNLLVNILIFSNQLIYTGKGKFMHLRVNLEAVTFWYRSSTISLPTGGAVCCSRSTEPEK